MSRVQKTEVLVVGAGPVGMMTAIALSEHGVQTQIVDQRWRPSTHTYALVVHPATLRLLSAFRIADDLIAAGTRISKVVLYDAHGPQGEISFSALGGPYPFALVVPQSVLEQALEQRLHQNGVAVLWNHEVSQLAQDPSHPSAVVDRLEKVSMGYPIQSTEWVIDKTYTVNARYIVGADGYHSYVRTQRGLGIEAFGETNSFEVFELAAPAPAADEVRIVLADQTSNVLWPVGEGGCRWTFQTDNISPKFGALERLQQLIDQRAPWFTLDRESLHWSSGVGFERRLARRFGTGGYWLAGDAAHLTGPIGAQSMNIGLREGCELATNIGRILHDGASIALLEHYHESQQREWHTMFGLHGGLIASSSTSAWVRDLRSTILPCIPASGDDLRVLLKQLGLFPSTVDAGAVHA